MKFATDSAYSALIHLAAEMAQQRGMPSEHYDDHPWLRTTPMAERRRVLNEIRRAADQCREWAFRLRVIADQMRAARAAQRTSSPRMHEGATPLTSVADKLDRAADLADCERGCAADALRQLAAMRESRGENGKLPEGQKYEHR